MPKLSSILIALIVLLLLLALLFLLLGNQPVAEGLGLLAIGLSFWAEIQLRREP